MANGWLLGPWNSVADLPDTVSAAPPPPAIKPVELPPVDTASLSAEDRAAYTEVRDKFRSVSSRVHQSRLLLGDLSSRLQARRMTLNPLAIILTVSFWIWMWGPIGGVIGLPLLIMFKVVCDHTPPLRVVGALIGAPLVRATKEEPAPARKVKVVIEDPPLPEGEPGAPEASPSDALAARVATPT
mgnify:CR=1 FL=1